MKTQIVSASKIIDVPADELYRIIADYQSGHPSILPKSYFPSLEVEEGGYGEGTIIRFQMRILGQTQNFRALITEPDPGCTLLETDLDSKTSTSFTVWSLGNDTKARVTIMTVLKDRGLVEGFLAKMLLTTVYRQELELLTNVARKDKRIVHATSRSHHVHSATSK
jgi:hypothetical protein